MARISKKASLGQSLGPFLAAIIAFLAVRWIAFEPYTIPSGSMLPSLLLHDYVIVNKSAFGVRIPFTSQWLLKWSAPKAGEVVVFRAPTPEGLFFIKRIVGVGGDSIEWTANGKLRINGHWIESEPASIESLRYGHPSGQNIEPRFALPDYEIARQHLGQGEFLAWLRGGEEFNEIAGSAKVPEGHFFVIGDNRINSYDSRYFGPVSENELMGRALFVILSCGDTVQNTATICDPKTIRWDRWFQKIK